MPARSSAPAPPDWAAVRAQFPAVERHVYLNTASGGPLSDAAATAVHRYIDEQHADGDLHWDDWLAESESIRARVATFIGATPEEIAFLPNASLGLNYAAALLHEAVPEGAAVLALADEFPSVTLPWLLHDRRVRFAPTTDAGAPIDLDAARLPNVRALLTSHVQYRTGYRADVEALGAWCQQHGLAFVLDATQAFGAFPLDVRRAGLDLMTASTYKWTGAGYGMAVLYVRRDLLRQALPAIGWRSARTPYALSNDRLDPADTARALELGHPAFPALFALGGALTVLEALGPKAIAGRILSLSNHLHQRLQSAGYHPALHPDLHHRSGITMLPLHDAPAVATALAQEDIHVAARGVGLRIAVHFYNNTDDLDRLVAALLRHAPPRPVPG